MEIHEKVEYSHLRVFDDGCSYSSKDEYLCIMSVHHLGDDEKFISGLKGIMSRKIYRMVKTYLESNGAKLIRYEKVKPNGGTKPQQMR